MSWDEDYIWIGQNPAILVPDKALAHIKTQQLVKFILINLLILQGLFEKEIKNINIFFYVYWWCTHFPQHDSKAEIDELQDEIEKVLSRSIEYSNLRQKFFFGNVLMNDNMTMWVLITRNKQSNELRRKIPKIMFLVTFSPLGPF